MTHLRKVFISAAMFSFMGASYAELLVASIRTTDAQQNLIGEVIFTDTPYGLLIQPSLKSLPAGIHGFHVHQVPNCGDKGMAAGGHYDPAHTNSHDGPYGTGHKGDLPVLYVDASGSATLPILAPRLKTSDIKGLPLMIHDGGDNYSNHPPMGGGGARMACGLIASKPSA